MLRNKTGSISTGLTSWEPTVSVIGQHIAVTILGRVLIKHLIFKGTIGTHQIQITHNHTFERFQTLRSQHAKLINRSFLNRIRNPCHIFGRERDDRAVRLFQGTADFPCKTELQHDFILDTLLNFIQQYLSLFIPAQLTLLNHVLIGLFPSQIGSNKEADKLFVGHTLMPITD